MTSIQPENDTVPSASTNHPRARIWRLLGWVNSVLCLLVLIAAAIFLSVLVRANRVILVDVDWSFVPVLAQPSLWLCLLVPLWLPLAAFPLTAIAAVGCFRYSRGRDAFALLLFYVFAMASVAVLALGVGVHLKYMGPLAIGPSTLVVFAPEDLFVLNLSTTILFVPAVGTLTALWSTHAMKERNASQARGD